GRGPGGAGTAPRRKPEDGWQNPGGAGLPCRPLTAQWGRSTAGAPQAPGGPDKAPVKSASSAGTRRGLMTGGPSPGWVPWMADVLASARGRWWDMMLLLDQLGGIWEIAAGANSPQPGPAGLKRSFWPANTPERVTPGQ